jgi:tetratricopeptide (TPR) repeat protein
MIALLIAAATAAAPVAAAPTDCAAGSGGAICRAVQASASGRPGEAAAEFEAAAAALSIGPERDRALAAAGNMYLAAGQPGKAAVALDRALAGNGLQAEQRGEAQLDRARASEGTGDLTDARRRVTEASRTVGDDPFLWYFSTALAIREGDATTAVTHAAKALALAPDEPLLLFEAGHAAQLAGDTTRARQFWRQTLAKAAAGSVEAKGAGAALAMLDAPPTPPRTTTSKPGTKPTVKPRPVQPRS